MIDVMLFDVCQVSLIEIVSNFEVSREPAYVPQFIEALNF